MRWVLIIALSIWGVFGLVGMLRVREGPEMRRARLLSALCGLLLAVAVFTNRLGHPLPALLSAGIGIGCGIAWLRILYCQSLHNTTM